MSPMKLNLPAENVEGPIRKCWRGKYKIEIAYRPSNKKHKAQSITELLEIRNKAGRKVSASGECGPWI